MDNNNQPAQTPQGGVISQASEVNWTEPNAPIPATHEIRGVGTLPWVENFGPATFGDLVHGFIPEAVEFRGYEYSVYRTFSHHDPTTGEDRADWARGMAKIERSMKCDGRVCSMSRCRYYGFVRTYSFRGNTYEVIFTRSEEVV